MKGQTMRDQEDKRAEKCAEDTTAGANLLWPVLQTPSNKCYVEICSELWKMPFRGGPSNTSM